jgi:hypothetical protein
MVTKMAGYRPEIVLRPEMPTGPLNRVADNSLAKRLLGWQPRTNFSDGLKTTLEWYFANKNADEVAAIFDHMLTGRGSQPAPGMGSATVGAPAQHSAQH